MLSPFAKRITTDCEEVLAPSVARLEKLKNQMVYVTGGTGFVGTWIAEMISLLNDRYQFNTSLFIVSRYTERFRENMPHIANRKNVRLISMDVKNTMEIPADVSYIIHAAATPDNRQHVSDPLGTMETITRGTSSVIESALKLSNLKMILNISSGQIYGRLREDVVAVPENLAGAINCNSITAVYPEAKRYAETIGCAYWSLYKIPVVSARPFAFIGPYQALDKPWAVNNFIRDALMNNSIRIIGNGMPVRGYMYPSDMAHWLLRILIDGNPGSAYNVGSPYGISLKELAEKIRHYAGTTSEIIIKHMNEDKSIFVPDDTLCKESLGLNIQVPIDEALKRSIRWFKDITKL